MLENVPRVTDKVKFKKEKEEKMFIEVLTKNVNKRKEVEQKLKKRFDEKQRDIEEIIEKRQMNR